MKPDTASGAVRALALLAALAATAMTAVADAGTVKYRYLEDGLVGEMTVVDQPLAASPRKPVAVALWTSKADTGSACALRAVEDVSRRESDGVAATVTLWVLDAQDRPTRDLIEIRFTARNAHIGARAGGDWCRNDAVFSGRWARVMPR